MKPLFSVLASRQIWAIHDHIARDKVGAAAEVVARILEVADFVSDNPGAGQATVRPGLRSISTKPYPYVILFRYLVTKERVRIVQIRHGARRRPALQEDASAFRV